MSVLTLLVLVLVIVVVGSLAYWVITKFLPPPSQMIALAIVGVILLLVLLGSFFPNVLGIKVA